MKLNLIDYKQYIIDGTFFNNKIFNLNSISFTSDVYYGSIVDLEDEYSEEDLRDAGLIIKRGKDLYIPKGYLFKIIGEKVDYFTAICRNDVYLSFSDIEDLTIDIELTKDIETVMTILKQFGFNRNVILHDILDKLQDSHSRRRK